MIPPKASIGTALHFAFTRSMQRMFPRSRPHDDIRIRAHHRPLSHAIYHLQLSIVICTWSVWPNCFNACTLSDFDGNLFAGRLWDRLGCFLILGFSFAKHACADLGTHLLAGLHRVKSFCGGRTHFDDFESTSLQNHCGWIDCAYD